MKTPIVPILISFLILGVILAVIFLGGKRRAIKPEYVEIENKITQYIQNKHLNIRIHTSEYKTFLHDILLGEYPELTNSPDGKKILQYALDYLEIPQDKEEKLSSPPIKTSD